MAPSWTWHREKVLLGNLLRIAALAWFIHTFVETPLHEYGHYWVATALGAHAFIGGSEMIWNAPADVPALSRTLIFLAGGLISGSILSGFYFLVREPYRKGLLPIIASEFVYAPFDATTTGYVLGLMAWVAVWSLIVAVCLIRFFEREPSGQAPTPGLQAIRVRNATRID